MEMTTYGPVSHYLCRKSYDQCARSRRHFVKINFIFLTNLQLFYNYYYCFYTGLKYTLLLTRLTKTSTTQHVIDAYTHALLGKYPRIRYTVGLDANLYLFLAKLPDWLSDMLFSTFGMPPKTIGC